LVENLPGRGPKYLRIADALRGEIASGELVPGDRLPSEASLLERFGVSLPTLRQATGVLRAEGLIESRHGVGTFVKQESRLERRSRSRYGRARKDRELLTSSLDHDIVFAGREEVAGRVAAALGVQDGTQVVVRRRHLRDKQSRRLEEIGASYIPDFAWGTYVEEPTVVPQALFLCIEEISGKKYVHARDEWVSRPASAAEAEAFDLPSGAPVLHLMHTASADDSTILEVSESVWPADRVLFVDEYEITQDPDQPEVTSRI